jgi:ribose-phosphate pyrophosphokinase
VISLGDVIIKPTHFPDGTSQVWKIPTHLLDMPIAIVKWDFSHEGELIHLAQLKELLDSQKIEATLFISFLPYARQDKEISNNSTFAIHPFIKFLNSLKFRKVVILDPHSDAAKDIDNHIFHFPVGHLKSVIDALGITLLVYPDAGALSRYDKIYDFGLYTLTAEKIRNQSTGSIVKIKIPSAHIADGRKVLIVDDICDGGATFETVARELSPYSKEISLFVTHGIFSKGLKGLAEAGIKNIFTAKGRVTTICDQIAFEEFT